MKIYNFSKEVGKDIQAFDSRNLIMSRILTETDSIHIGCLHLSNNGIIGLHQAPIPQLLLVVDGEGWVKGKEDREYRIHTGFAAYWEEGEWHETRTEKGLTAIVIESTSMIPKMKEELF